MRKFIISDPHFGQKSLYLFNKKYNCILRPEFKNPEECAKRIIENCNSIIPKDNSILYILGDLAHNITYAKKYVTQLNGQAKFLIMGNHDSNLSTSSLSSLFKKLYGVLYLDDKYVLTHIPIHNSQLRGMINIHGHTHRYIIDDDNYINACLEPNNYFPLEITSGGLINHVH